jgi:hypothetical protein
VPLLGSEDPSQQWGFLSTFEMSDPWAQRALYGFCDSVPDDLKVAQSWCWMRDFRSFVKMETELQFPVQASKFGAVAGQFYTANYATAGDRYIWQRGGDIKAVYFSFAVDVDKNELGSPALELKAKWDAHLADFNSRVRSSSEGAFHVSELWVAAESASVLLSTTAQTLGILLILAFVGMLLFTSSVVLSLYVVLATTCVMAGLLFIIVVALGWKIGLIEVIAIIYFVGYAVTYSLHIAHKYARAQTELTPHEELLVTFIQGDGPRARYARTVYSMKALGGAAVGSAMTTIFASFFLLFCTLTIFVKLGSMCLAVSTLSLIMALGPLPAFLMMCGPINPGRCRCNPVQQALAPHFPAAEGAPARARE